MNVIIIPFAYKENYKGGENILEKDALTTYLKNCVVSCVSAKVNNTQCDVILATNFELPIHFLKIFSFYNIKVIKVPFTSFCFDSKMTWSLAFYKLCVLEWAVNNTEYENILYLDADCVTQNNLDNLWIESAQNILLYDINHGLQIKDYQILIDECSSYFKTTKYITHYGGEFFCANKSMAKEFIQQCCVIYNKMIEENLTTTKGDEFILSIAASNLKQNVKNAGGYIYRYWTSYSFRLVSTNYKYNPVFVLHMPQEKQRGIIKLYNLISKGKKITNKKIWSLCRLKRITIIDFLHLCKETIFKRNHQ